MWPSRALVLALLLGWAVPASAGADTSCDVAASGHPVGLLSTVAFPLGHHIDLVQGHGRVVQKIPLPADPGVPAGVVTTLPALSVRGRAATATVAWSTNAATVQRVHAAVMDSSGRLTRPTTVSTTGDDSGALDAAGSVVAGGRWIAWSDEAGPRAALIADDGTAGPPIALPVAGQVPTAAVSDPTGTGWVLLRDAAPGDSGASLVQLSPGAPPRAFDVSALTDFRYYAELALAADGRGGVFAAAQPTYWGSARIPVRIVHISDAGVTNQTAVTAGSYGLGLGAATGRALIAYATRVGRHTDVAVRTVSSSGRLGAGHRITTTARRDEFPGDVSLQQPSHPIVALRSGSHVYLASLTAALRPTRMAQVSRWSRHNVLDPRVTRAGNDVFTTWDSSPSTGSVEDEWTMLGRGLGASLAPASTPIHRLATGSCTTDEG